MAPLRPAEARTVQGSAPWNDRKALAQLRERLKPYLGSNGRRMALFVIASVLGGLGEALLLYVIVRIATAIAAGDEQVPISVGALPEWTVSIGPLFVAAFVLIVLVMLVATASAVLTARMSVVALTSARRRTFDAFLAASWDLQSQERQGDLQELLTTHVKRIAGGAVALANGIAAAVSFVTLLAAALLFSPIAASTILIGVLALYFILRPLTRLVQSRSREHVIGNSAYAVNVTEAAELAREIRAFDVSDSVGHEMAMQTDEVGRLNFAAQRLAQIGSHVYRNVALLLVVTCMLVVYVFDVGDLANLGAVVLLLVRALTHSQRIQASIQQANEVVPYIEQLSRRQRLYLENAVTPGPAALGPVRSIAFSNVSFGYLPGHPVLEHVSFDIRAGEAIGIVGPSGTGKSTLVQLLLGLRAPEEGEYRVNGELANAFTAQSWSRQIAFVPQDNRLLHASVADNVRFHRDWIEDADVERAVRAAHLHDEATLLPNGYDTVIGSGAMELSGGQRQRLGLARALAGAPTVLLLDEPTSALDMRSEALIQQTFEELRGSLTMLIVAHRMTTLRRSDRLMVLGEGGIQAFATPVELADSNGFYQDATRLSRIPW